MKKIKVFVMVILGISAVVGTDVWIKHNTPMGDIGGITLNEVCSWNQTTIKDSERNYSDYIELYNSSAEPVSLSGWHLSDDLDELEESILPDMVVEPGGYVLFYANGGGEDVDSLSFRISSEGETVFLSDAEGNLVDSIVVPMLDADTVYARVEDGADEWRRMEPSPGQTNSGSVCLRNPVLETPRFSHQSGFYEDAFLLKLYADFGETIYYTLDGSEPTENSLVYNGPILIEEVSSQPNVYNSV